MPTSPRKKKIVIGLATCGSGLALLLALAPTLINFGIGQGVIRGAIEKHINGTVAMDNLHLTWFGPQIIEGFSLTDDRGEQVANLDLQLASGLGKLIAGDLSRIELDVSGSINLNLYENGDTSLSTLMPVDQPAPDQSETPAPFSSLASFDFIDVSLDGVTVNLHDIAADRTITLNRLSGGLTYDRGSPLAITLKADTQSRGVSGSMEFTGTLTDFFDAAGRLTPEGAGVELIVHVRSVPVPLTDGNDTLEQLDIVIRSDDLAVGVELTIEATAALSSRTPSRFAGSLSIDSPLTDAGQLDIGLDSLRGTLQGTQVPTSLLQPFLAESGIVLIRDVGPVVDIAAEFSRNGQKYITVKLVGRHLSLELEGVADAEKRSFTGNRLELRADIQPELIQSLADIRIDRPATLFVNLTSFSIPPRKDGEGLPLAGLTAVGSLQLDIDEPIALLVSPGDQLLAHLDLARLEFDTDSLGEGLTIRGEAQVSGGMVTFEERLTNMFDDEGRLALSNMLIEGRTEIDNFPGTVIASLISDTTGLADHLFDEPCRAVITTSIEGGGMRHTIDFSTPGLSIRLVTLQAPQGLVVEDGRIQLVVTPEMARIMQRDSEQPVGLLRPVTMTIIPNRQTIPGRDWSDYDFLNTPLSGELILEDVALTVDSVLTEPVLIRDMHLNLSARLGVNFSLATSGSCAVFREVNGVPVGNATIDIELAGNNEARRTTGTIRLTDLDINQIEVLMGRDHNEWAHWIGDRGELTIRTEPKGAETIFKIEPTFTRFAGSFRIESDLQRIRISGSSSKFVVSSEMFNQGLGSLHGKSPNPSDVTEMRVTQDVPLMLTVKSLTLPRGMIEGKAFDADDFDLNITLSGGPITLTGVNGLQESLNDITASITSTNLSKVIAFNATAQQMLSKGMEYDGKFEIRGRIHSLYNASGSLDLNQAKLELKADVSHTPTILADTLLNMHGLLVAAVGPQMRASFEAQDFSTAGGTLKGRIETTHGWLDASLMGSDGLIHTAVDTPITAQLALTESLRRRLLYQIAPVLADIRTVNKPIDFTVSHVDIPVDGDVSRLNADIEIIVGEVEFDSGSISLGLLSIFNASNTETLPGYIEPIRANIRKGIVSYEKFNVHIDKYILPFSGTIDLNRKYVDMRSQAPLMGLALSIKELRDFGDLEVPIVIRGPFGDVKTEIDPEFDLGKLIFEASILRGLDELFKNLDKHKGGGNLLDDIFGNASGGAPGGGK